MRTAEIPNLLEAGRQALQHSPGSWVGCLELYCNFCTAKMWISGSFLCNANTFSAFAVLECSAMVCSGKTLLAHHLKLSVPLKGTVALQTAEWDEWKPSCVWGFPRWPWMGDERAKD